ncbi:MAG TPA: PAS domain S-box protein [Prolixibacteraceae bacterium]|nr:PAS domain S-box protein [Prolixibacteraceae bacterium]
MDNHNAEGEKSSQSLTNSEEKYHYIFMHNPQPMWIYDLETLAFLEVNEAAVNHYGYSRDEFFQMTIKDIRPAEDIPILYENINNQPSAEPPSSGWRHIKKNGEIIYVEITASSVYYEGRKARHILINDITQRRLAEEKIQHMTRLYAFLSHINQAIVQTKDQEELFNLICKIAIEHGQFRMAWIGITDENSKTVQPVAMAGHVDGYLTERDFSADNQPTGLGPVGTAAREGNIRICSDVASDPGMIVWRERALQRGYHSLAAIPLRCREKIVGTLALYSKDSGFFTDDEQKLLQEIGDDISFAIDAIVTEKESRQAQLEAQRLRQALDLITAHVYIKDLQLRYVYANKQTLGLFGCSLTELIGNDDSRFFPLEALKKIVEIDNRVIRGEETSEEIDINDPSKGRRVYWEVKVPIYDNAEDKNICGLLGISTDITERKLVEERLRESEIKYRTFFESSIDGILLTDALGNTLDANPAVCNMFGYSEEEMIEIGKKGLLDPEDNQLAHLLNQRNQHGRAQGEVSFMRKDGTKFPAEISSSLFMGSDNNLRGSVIIRDISERRNINETVLKLSRAVDQTGEAIVITDKDGLIEYVNHAYEVLTGYTLEEVMGKNPGILKSGKHTTEFYKQLWMTILSGNVLHTEVVNKKKNGELFIEQKTISPIFDENRNITHFIGTGVDITERKIAEKELIKAKEKAVESDRLKSAFLANMSHEVRTPLNSILGFSSLLGDSVFDEYQREVFIHHIIQNGNNLLNIINDIMDISKIESGEIKIHKHPVDAFEFVTTIKHQFALQAEERKLELKLTIPSTKETIVYADRDRLNQIIINLISNALKFTKEGSIELGYLPKGDQVLFFVIDTGIGIPAEYHQKIFERFRQVEMENTRKYGGNGLGLAITKNLVELMDGHIWLQSEPGKGSAFYFTLPAYKEDPGNK